MRTTVTLFAAALLLPIRAASAADAPPPERVRVFCQPGSLNNCFAVGFEDSQGHLTLFIQNLQGSIQAGGSSFAIKEVTYIDQAVNIDSRPGTVGIGGIGLGPTVSTQGNVRLGGFQSFSYENAPVGSYSATLFTFGLGFAGCQLFDNPPGNLDFYAQTCLPAGLDGWARFDATGYLFDNSTGAMLRPLTFEDFYVRVAGCDVIIGAQSGVTSPSGLACATDIDYASLSASFTPVPEPTTIALLASGLAGLVPAIRRRRAT